MNLFEKVDIDEVRMKLLKNDSNLYNLLLNIRNRISNEISEYKSYNYRRLSVQLLDNNEDEDDELLHSRAFELENSVIKNISWLGNKLIVNTKLLNRYIIIGEFDEKKNQINEIIYNEFNKKNKISSSSSANGCSIL